VKIERFIYDTELKYPSKKRNSGDFMVGKYNPNGYEFRQYCDFVEGTLIDKVIPELLAQGDLDNRVACYHVGDQFASFIAIPPEARRYVEDPQYADECRILAEAGLLGRATLEEHLGKRKQQFCSVSANTDIKDASIRFEHCARREYKGWHYLAVQHDGKTKSLKEMVFLFHPDALNISERCLDGKKKI